MTQFQHSGEIWRDFPALVPGVLYATGITADATRVYWTDYGSDQSDGRIRVLPQP